jgi:hypothetical protein
MDQLPHIRDQRNGTEARHPDDNPDNALRRFLDQSMKAYLAERHRYATPQQLEQMRHIANALMGDQYQPKPTPTWVLYGLATGDFVTLGRYLQWDCGPIVRAIGDLLASTPLQPSSGGNRFQKARKAMRHCFLACQVALEMENGAGKEKAVQDVACRFKRGASSRNLYDAFKKYGETAIVLHRLITAKKS